MKLDLAQICSSRQSDQSYSMNPGSTGPSFHGKYDTRSVRKILQNRLEWGKLADGQRRNVNRQFYGIVKWQRAHDHKKLINYHWHKFRQIHLPFASKSILPTDFFDNVLVQDVNDKDSLSISTIRSNLKKDK